MSQSNLIIFRPIKCGNIVPGWLWIVLSVPRTWLIVWFPEVVDRQNLQVCRAARVNIRILCTCMKTLRECLVFCLRQPILGSRKVNSSFSRASRREPHNLRDRKVGSEKQILPIIFYCLRTAINFSMTVPFMYNFRNLSHKFHTIFWRLIFHISL